MKILLTFLFIILLALFTIWFMVAQPIFAYQAGKYAPIKASSTNLKNQVYTIVEKFNNRGYTNTQILDKTAEYIHKMFSVYSDDVSYQVFEAQDPQGDITRKYKNVIATFKGREECEDGIYVIGGHYDTFGGYVGANDNTSAVVGLIELARLFKDNPPQCTLQIVAYTLEEPPFFRTQKMGSYIHAKSLKKSHQKVKLVIVLDMIGFFSDEENSQTYPLSVMKFYYPSKANYISIVSNLSLKNIQYVRKIKSVFSYTSKLPAYSINAFSFIPGIDFSDHYNYWKFDYPAVLITDTAFYRSNNYHTMNDTPDTLDYKKMAKVIGSVFNMVRGNGRKLNAKQVETNKEDKIEVIAYGTPEFNKFIKNVKISPQDSIVLKSKNI